MTDLTKTANEAAENNALVVELAQIQSEHPAYYEAFGFEFLTNGTPEELEASDVRTKNYMLMATTADSFRGLARTEIGDDRLVRSLGERKLELSKEAQEAAAEAVVLAEEPMDGDWNRINLNR